MATAGPTVTYEPDNYRQIVWTEVATGTTPDEYLVPGTAGIAGSFQAAEGDGAWGGATIVMQGSNNGTDWVTIDDPLGNPISLTADGAFEISTSMLYIRPLPSGGSSDDVDVTVILRG